MQIIERAFKYSRELPLVMRTPRMMTLARSGIVFPCQENKSFEICAGEYPQDELYQIQWHPEKTKKGERVVYTYTQSPSSGLDLFIATMAEVMAFRDVVDAYIPHATKGIDEKVDAFLRKNTQKDYAQFFEGFDAGLFSTGDFAAVPRGLRRKLFKFRTEVYAIALATTEAAGYGLAEMIEDVHRVRIVPIKKERDEPTFMCLREQVRRYRELLF